MTATRVEEAPMEPSTGDTDNEEETSIPVVDLSLLDAAGGSGGFDGNGAPDSRDAFLSRLRTFLPLTYFCKPPSLSPILCARFGWINSGRDMLQCVHCKAALAIIIHSKLSKSQSIRKLVSVYQGKLASSHTLSCPFRLDAEQHFHLLCTQSTNNDNAHSRPCVTNSCDENVVPPLLASVLPRDVWDLVESPSPVSLLRDRFRSLTKVLLKRTDVREGLPPQWEFPPLVLPKDILEFDTAADPESTSGAAIISDDSHPASAKNSKSSRKRRVLARLAFDPHHPETALGLEHETMLSKLEKLLMPPGNNEIEGTHVQTRAQNAWEDFYEVVVALALFGWIPATNSHSHPSDTPEESMPVCLECPVCLSQMDFQMHAYDGHHHHHGTSPKKRLLYSDDSDEDDRGGESHDGATPPPKRRKVHRFSTKINAISSHRFYCPYVCGFPRDGERKGIPFWKTIASKMLGRKEPKQKHSEDHGAFDEDPSMDRILRLLDASVSSRVGGSC